MRLELCGEKNEMAKKTTREQYLLKSLASIQAVEPEDVWDEACDEIGEEFTYRKITKGERAPARILDYLEWQYRQCLMEEQEIHRKCAEYSKELLPFFGKVFLGCLAALYLLSLL